MLKDLGLHLQSGNNPSLAKLEPDDLEATKRLCLSAYAWDKSISLCLGRRPALSEMPFHPSSLRTPQPHRFLLLHVNTQRLTRRVS